MRTSLMIVACAALVACVAATNTTFVMTKDGGLTGATTSDHTRQWLGIPFAQPPVGDLRWKAPEPVTPWGSNLDALAYKPACYQSNNTFTIFNTVSEDCLYLNVYAPPVAKSKNLPVMLFFYGGSWAEGAASFLLYDGETDVGYVEDVIFVTANYRLNVFGFLGSEALADESPNGSTGNLGLLDQRQAMAWVKKNIAAFGGDPNNVMIFGESAGAGSVSCHLIMPNSNGYFDKAGMESGPIADWTAMPLYAAQDKYTYLVNELGCTGTDEQVIACLRSKDAKTVFEASKGAPSALTGDLTWGPTVDGVEIPDDPRKLGAEGKFNKVPVLLGTNMDEGTIFLKANHDINITGMYDFIAMLFGTDLAGDVMAQYPLANYSKDHPTNTAWWALSHVFGDSQMSCPARRTARWLSESTGQPVYLYFFSHILEIIQLFVPFKGCCHGSELPFVFDFHEILIGDGEKPLAQQFVRYWTRFAATGNPNGGNDPEWPAYEQATDMNIDMNIPVKAMTGLKNELCNFWDLHPLPYSRIWKNSSSINA